MEQRVFDHPGGVRGDRVAAEVADGAIGKVATLLLLTYIVTKPFYLFPSGGPQIADGLIALLLIWAVFSAARLPAALAGVFYPCLYFTIYTFFVNCVWALVLGDLSMLKTPIFYAFNSVLIFILFSFYSLDRERTLQILLIGSITTLFVQFLLALTIIGLGTAGRDSLFFNNPNQLGYWALLSVSIFAVATRAVHVRLIWHMAAFALSFFLISISLGKAATLALGLLFVVHFSRNWWHFVLAALFGGILILAFQNQPMMEELSARLANIGEQRDDSLAARGYGRILNHPEHLLFGAGEFGLDRFPEERIEMHSTLGTILFSYGVIGTAIFMLILLRLLKRSGWPNFMYLAPAFAYGITHQGLRFSLLWILFATLALTGDRRHAGGHAQNVPATRASLEPRR